MNDEIRERIRRWCERAEEIGSPRVSFMQHVLSQPNGSPCNAMPLHRLYALDVFYCYCQLSMDFALSGLVSRRSAEPGPRKMLMCTDETTTLVELASRRSDIFSLNLQVLYRYRAMRNSAPHTYVYGPRDFWGPGSELGPGIIGRDELLEGARKVRKVFLKGLAHYKGKHPLYGKLRDDFTAEFQSPCDNCFATPPRVSYCGRCATVVYCSRYSAYISPRMIWSFPHARSNSLQIAHGVAY